MATKKISDNTADATPDPDDHGLIEDKTSGAFKSVLFKYFGWLRRNETKTVNWTLVESDSGKSFFVNAVDLVATLPSTSTRGVVFTFVIIAVSATTGFSVSPAATDNINGGTDNKDFINTAATDVLGDSVTIESDGTNWFTTSKVGTWAAEA